MTPHKLLALSLRLMRGKRALGFEALAKTPNGRARALKTAVSDMREAATTLDTTDPHKAMILDELAYITARIDAKPHPSWALVFGLLRLNMRLLGYNELRGGKQSEPRYYKLK